MILAAVGALVVGLSLGVFGSGGSILTVPLLVYLLGHEDKIAIAESLAIVSTIAAAGSVPYIRDGDVDWRAVALFAPPGLAGTYGGAWLASHVPGVVQLLVLAGAMLVASLRMWRRSGSAIRDDARASSLTHLLIAQGLGVGVLTGFVGVGGGFLIVPALAIMARLPMRRAVATSLVIIAMNSAVGLWKHVGVLGGTEVLDWGTIGTFAGFGVVGSLVGKAINSKLNQSLLKRGFAAFLLLIAGFILVRETASLPNAEVRETHTTGGVAP
ncbi:MAG: sulfite exporter TauE/SafE family protein [Planctomycetota bacterium]